MKVFVYYSQSDYQDRPEPSIWFHDISKTFPNYIFAGTIEIDLPPPPSRNEMVAAKVSELRSRQGALQAEITKIDGKIQELLCIELKVVES